MACVRIHENFKSEEIKIKFEALIDVMDSFREQVHITRYPRANKALG